MSRVVSCVKTTCLRLVRFSPLFWPCYNSRCLAAYPPGTHQSCKPSPPNEHPSAPGPQPQDARLNPETAPFLPRFCVTISDLPSPLSPCSSRENCTSRKTKIGAEIVQKWCSFGTVRASSPTTKKGGLFCLFRFFRDEPRNHFLRMPIQESVRFRSVFLRKGGGCDFPEPPIRVPFSKQASPEPFSKPRSAGVRTRSGFKLPAIPNHFSPVPSSWPLRLGTAALRVRGFERASPSELFRQPRSRCGAGGAIAPRILLLALPAAMHPERGFIFCARPCDIRSPALPDDRCQP